MDLSLFSANEASAPVHTTQAQSQTDGRWLAFEILETLTVISISDFLTWEDQVIRGCLFYTRCRFCLTFSVLLCLCPNLSDVCFGAQIPC